MGKLKLPKTSINEANNQSTTPMNDTEKVNLAKQKAQEIADKYTYMIDSPEVKKQLQDEIDKLNDSLKGVLSDGGDIHINADPIVSGGVDTDDTIKVDMSGYGQVTPTYIPNPKWDPAVLRNAGIGLNQIYSPPYSSFGGSYGKSFPSFDYLHGNLYPSSPSYIDSLPLGDITQDTTTIKPKDSDWMNHKVDRRTLKKVRENQDKIKWDRDFTKAPLHTDVYILCIMHTNKKHKQPYMEAQIGSIVDKGSSNNSVSMLFKSCKSEKVKRVVG